METLDTTDTIATESTSDQYLQSSAILHVAQSPPLADHRESKIPSSRSPFVWWHVLSLDAPTVAGLWCWFFAASFHVKLHRFAIPTIVLGAWCVYVADRLLDGWRVSDTTLLRERHWFYLRHRRAFVIAWLPAAILLGYFIAQRLQRAERTDEMLLCLLGIVYFLIIHGFGRGVAARISKELVVGFLFALATAVPAWALLRHHGMLLTAVLAFGAGCWLNCVAIQIWEDTGKSIEHSDLHPQRTFQAHAVTARIGKHLKAFATAVFAVAICLAITFIGTYAWPIFAAVALSAGVFLWLIHHSRRFRTLHLRIAADAALLTPLCFVFLLH